MPAELPAVDPDRPFRPEVAADWLRRRRWLLETLEADREESIRWRHRARARGQTKAHGRWKDLEALEAAIATVRREIETGVGEVPADDGQGGRWERDGWAEERDRLRTRLENAVAAGFGGHRRSA